MYFFVMVFYHAGHVKKDEALVTTKALCDDFLKKENASSDDRFQKEVSHVR